MSETPVIDAIDTPPPPRWAGRGDLTKGSVGRHLVRLAVPMSWGIMAIISFQLVNTFWVSFLGTEKLAAISFTFPITYAILNIVIGFGIAMSSVISRLIGAGQKETMVRVVTHGLALVWLTGIVIGIIGFIFQDSIFRLMGAEEDMIPLIRDYMSIWFAGMLFFSLPMVGNSVMRADGDSFTPALIITLAAVSNALLDPLLIFGLFGLPRLELQGAAISTVIANAGAMATGLYIIAARKKMLSFRVGRERLSEFGDSAKRILSIAVPVSLTSMIHPLLAAFILSLLAAYGPEAVAAMGVVTRVEAFALVILMGVAVGMAPIIGQNWGAKKFARVNETLKLAISFSVIWSVLVAIVLGVFAKPVASAFSNDPEVISVALKFFLIVPFSYVFFNLTRGWASAFNAMGMPKRSVILILVETLALMVPAVLIGEKLGGLTGIFIAIAAAHTASGLFSHFWSWSACKKLES